MASFDEIGTRCRFFQTKQYDFDLRIGRFEALQRLILSKYIALDERTFNAVIFEQISDFVKVRRKLTQNVSDTCQQSLDNPNKAKNVTNSNISTNLGKYDGTCFLILIEQVLQVRDQMRQLGALRVDQEFFLFFRRLSIRPLINIATL